MAGMCRPSPIILLLLLVVSTYGGPWSKLVPAAIASSSSAVTMEMIPQLRIELSIENCTVNGKFPIPESCETFYQCDDWDGLGMEMYKFTCPVGTIFDDHVSTCNFPSLFKSRPDCTSGEVQGNTVEEAINFSIVHAGYEMESVDLASGNDYAVRELMLNTIRDRTKRSAIIEEDHFTEESNVTEEIDLTEDILGEEDNITAECKVTILEHNITDSDFVANKALHSCKQIYKVDQYVDMVISMNPVKFPDFLRSVFNGTDADDYNNILKTAQNHTYIWRHGDDIMSGFRRTYELAKLFGPSFQRKFSVAQERLEIVKNLSDNIEQENEIQNEIELSEDTIKFYQVLINQTSPSEKMLNQFLGLINRIQIQVIEKKKKLWEIKAVERELDEIVVFLEFVKKDAGKIQEKANMTMQKLKTLKDNTLQDKSKFKQIRNLTESSIKSAYLQLNETRQDIKNKKEQLKELKVRQRNETKKLEEFEDAILAEIDTLSDKLNKFSETMKIIGKGEKSTSSSSFCAVGSFLCFSTTSSKTTVNIEQVKVAMKAMEVVNNAFDSNVNSFLALIKGKHSQLNDTTHIMVKLQENIFKKWSEVRNLGRVQFYLNIVVEQSEKIIPYIENAIEGLKGLEQTFESVVFNLETLITQAREVQEPAQKRRYKELFFLNMHDMQTSWNKSYSDIIDIGSCTDSVYYNALVEIIKATELPINNTLITERNCTTVIEPSTINDTTTTPTTPTTTTTTTTEPYIDFN